MSAEGEERETTLAPTTQPESPAGFSRRFFLKIGALTGTAVAAGLASPETADACSLPITGAGWPSVNGWEHRTLMHFLNTIFPGDNGQQLFWGDSYPLKSGGDTSAGAFRACTLDVLYDPYFGVAGTNSNLLATTLDWATRLNGYAWYFYQASQYNQLRVVDSLTQAIFIGSGFEGAASLAIGAVLGAFKNYSVTQLIGWGGPNGGYYSASRHPLSRWLQPTRMTTNGNLP
jgi:hypothetical protein